ncbi:MAG: type II secretion system protein GspC [Gammaproteobacteria bacterium TMED78]|nr:MAG: type II secretion system protein GspC [Gammaproteobacteria bacterium TMED78]|tara:strand:+ start:469 stop:1398 length:930 start_codon:yes stop_codon:yes gene_type:complete
MNVNIDLIELKSILSSDWIIRAYKYLPFFVAIVLMFYLANILSSIAWRIIYNDSIAINNLPEMRQEITNTDNNLNIDINTITNNNLFGVLADSGLPLQPDFSSFVNTPETNLNIQLRGVVFGESDNRSVAIILTDNNEEKVFRVNDVITNNGTTVLYAIYGDKVILNRAGNLETLSLPKNMEENSTSLNISIQNNNGVQSNSSIRNIITNNASKITDILRVAPHIQEGKMVGFRVSPGSSQDQFETLGLQSGDVVLDINGTAMSDPSNALQVFESLNESTYASLTILRNGDRQVISIDTSQLQELEENL